MNTTVYSNNGEDFNYYEIDEALEYAENGVHQFWSGDAVPFKVESFIPNMAEIIGERAYDESEEFGDTWPEHGSELQAMVLATVKAWADEYDQHPKCCEVLNIKEFTVVISFDEVDESTIREVTA